MRLSLHLIVNIKYSDKQIKEAVKISSNWREVCEKIGANPRSGSQAYIKTRADKHNIDYSHFVGQNWSKGKRVETHYVPAIEYIKRKSVSSHRLKEKLLRENILLPHCNRCGLSKWLGEDSVLELDHIDGDHNNNTFLNLQILCPNCHSLKTRHDRR